MIKLTEMGGTPISILNLQTRDKAAGMHKITERGLDRLLAQSNFDWWEPQQDFGAQETAKNGTTDRTNVDSMLDAEEVLGLPGAPIPRAVDVFEAPEELPEGPEAGWPILCCVAGPCKHYLEIAQVTRVITGVEHRNLYRYCRLLAEDNGTMALQELTIRSCTGYSPPWYSLSGWRQRLLMISLQIRAARQSGGTITLNMFLLALLARAFGYLREPGKALAGRKEQPNE